MASEQREQELELVTLTVDDLLNEDKEIKTLAETVKKHQELLQTNALLHGHKLAYLEGLLQLYNKKDEEGNTLLDVMAQTLDEILKLKDDPKISKETLKQKYEATEKFARSAFAVYLGLVKGFELYKEAAIRQSRETKTGLVDGIRNKLGEVDQYING